MPVATNTAVATYNFYTSHKTAAILNLGRHFEKLPQNPDFYTNLRIFAKGSDFPPKTVLSTTQPRTVSAKFLPNRDQALALLFAREQSCPIGGLNTGNNCKITVKSWHLRQIHLISPKHFHHVLRWRLSLHILKPRVVYLHNPASSF